MYVVHASTNRACTMVAKLTSKTFKKQSDIPLTKFYSNENTRLILGNVIQIKIAMSKDKLCILINILAETHMAFDWQIKSTFGAHRPTDQLYSISSSF